jgi:DNA mismatch repair protein MutL
MSKIRILPEQLANQIAAGEVVERPSSVVKELVENSLDAGATRVEVEVEGGGTRLIKVVDDGEGMDEDDLLLSLERHGTSKIGDDKDLGAISTLGFRGEAVPSIGSVSKMVITSRPRGSDFGTLVALQYGRLIKVHESGTTFGTCFEIRSLFGNTPARRKFLRTNRTELGHIEEVVRNYSLARPDVTFVLRVDGRGVLHFDSSLSLEGRLAAILHYTDGFIPVDSGPEASRAATRISGYLLPPDRVKTGPGRLRIFVNRRVVKDRMIAHAISEGLRGFLMKGKNPCGLIHVEIPPDEVDVNVHPAKHEVRFRNARDVHNLVCQTVSKSMAGYQQTVKSTIFGKDRQPDRSAVPSLDLKPVAFDFERRAAERRPDTDFTAKTRNSAGSATQKQYGPTASPKPPANTGAAHRPDRQRGPELLQAAEPAVTNTGGPGSATRHNLIVIGQYDDLYIFCKNSEGLLVIDQHAAHERLLYEKLRRQYLAGSIARQQLLFPETVELTLFQSQLVEKNVEELDRMGFSIGEFGGETYIISAIPALAGHANPRSLFLDILEQFGSESGSGGKGGYLDNILASMACKAAVKAGTSLSPPEIDRLLDEMARADLFSHCPHGRPVVKQLSRDEIKKWFHRS